LLAEARAGNENESSEHAQAVGKALASIHSLLRESPRAAGEEAAPAPAQRSAAGPEVGEVEDRTAEARDQSPEGAGRAWGPGGGIDPPSEYEGPRRRASDWGDATSLRVRIDQVDRLVNLVGELVITQSMVSQAVTNFTPDKIEALKETVAQIDRHVRNLQERIMAIRMVPLKAAFGRLPRLVRDLSALCGKQVALEISGEDTELDKGVIEKIGDPLTHLIRNAVDHGLEAPQARIAAGKGPVGRINIQAYQEGGSIFVLVADDGRGIDVERVVARAVERGLVAPEQSLSEEEALALIFHPGVSTAEQVTEVSGRGVGMDVVLRNLEPVGGGITIRSERGKGTTFRIKLPLTVAILDGQLVQVGDQVYLLPLLNILESVRPAPGALHVVPGVGEVVVVRGQTIPLVRLHRLFGVDGAVTSPSEGLLVLVEHESRCAAVLVDEVLGQQQVVIKSLESNFRKVEQLVGATILGNGRVALIIDVAGLLRARGGRPGPTFGEVA
jgi:two-component system chemotaxis sensor kinase CheA